MSGTRKLAAIFAADVVGFSRLTGVEEERTLARLRALRGDLVDPAVAAYHGRIVKRTGDGVLVEFRSVVDAVRCALEVQQGMAERNEGVAENRQIRFRVGIHLGDVVEEDDGDLMGDGVNIAARLEGIAEPGGVYLSAIAYESVRDKIDVVFVDQGQRQLKNIARPVHVFSFETVSHGRVGAHPRTAAPASDLTVRIRLPSLYCVYCGALPGSATKCAAAYQSHTFVSGQPSSVYCCHCGARPGNPTTCAAGHQSHTFVPGQPSGAYCGNCGATPGNPTKCAAGYQSHTFIPGNPSSAYCRHCGATPGNPSKCAAGYRSHTFVRAK